MAVNNKINKRHAQFNKFDQEIYIIINFIILC